MTSVTIPNSVTSIGSGVFYDCSGLTSVNISDLEAWCKINFGDYSANPLYYAKKLYLNGELLIELVIPDSIKEIKNYAFWGCSSLTSIIIPNSVTSIGESAFYGCSGLTSVTIPNSVTSIGGRAFSGCSGLTSVTIPNSVTSIGESAFYGCSGLTSVTIPTSVTSIGYSAFYRCTGLTSVIFNAENCKTMGSESSPVFENCTKLSSVAIGENVKNIPSYAFSGCTGLTSVNILDLEAWCKINFAEVNSNPLFFAKNLYLNGELLTELVIPDSIKEIKNHAFSGCSSLTNVIIPNSVTSIGSSAFRDCSGLTSLTIPNSVTSIGSGVFSGRIALRELRIEDGETTLSLGINSYESSGIGDGLFYDCPLETLYLGRKLFYSTGEGYGYSPFYNNSSLKTVTVGNNVTSIEDYAFTNCSGLTSVTIPNSVTSIGGHAFEGCSGLTKVIIGSSVKTIGNYAFANIERLAKIYLLNNTPPTCASENIFNMVNKDKCTLYVPLGTAEDYKTTYVWWDFNNIIEKEMSGIEETLIDGYEDEHAEFYNLQGAKVLNPSSGLFIKRQGGKTSKVIL